MPNQIHGHEVLHMMIESATPFTHDGLKAAMAERFGVDARYYTCSAESLDAEQLIALLVEREKLHRVPGGFTTDPSRICEH